MRPTCTSSTGYVGIGCISDTDPQPLLVRSHLGLYAIYHGGHHQQRRRADRAPTSPTTDTSSWRMSSGKVNASELVAALINQKENLVEGILLRAGDHPTAPSRSCCMTPDGILAARDKLGRLPVLVGKHPDGSLCVSFESFAYHKLGYEDAYELRPARDRGADAETATRPSRPPGEEMKICAFPLDVLRLSQLQLRGRERRGHALSQRRHHGAAGARAGSPAGCGLRRGRAGFRRAARHRLRQPQRQALCQTLCQVHAHMAALVHARTIRKCAIRWPR